MITVKKRAEVGLTLIVGALVFAFSRGSMQPKEALALGAEFVETALQSPDVAAFMNELEEEDKS